MARSVNCVHLIGNLTRDPELHYTQSGKGVCNVRLATNRTWVPENGEKREETEYHTIILWGKLAEIASQYLHKGEKAYFQGRLESRSFTGKDGTEKSVTEIVAEDMLMLSGKPQEEERGKAPVKAGEGQAASGAGGAGKRNQTDFDVDPEEIPF